MSGCSGACTSGVACACVAGADAGGEAGYYGGEYLQDVAESGLVEVGGQALLDAAHDAAAAYVAWRYPWTGEGEEPAQRISAYIGVLTRQLDAARANAQRSPGA